MKFAPMADGSIDLVRKSSGIVPERGLETSIYISLLTDRRADVDDQLPDGGKRNHPIQPDRRGWCGDALEEIKGQRIGSRLWLLVREKQTNEVLNRAVTYCYEALQWMIDDGLVVSIDVTAEWAERGRLHILIIVYLPNGGSAEYMVKTGGVHDL